MSRELDELSAQWVDAKADEAIAVARRRTIEDRLVELLALEEGKEGTTNARTETGYAMPLEVWVQAAAAGLSIVELPVPLVYLDLARSFGGALDDAATRLAYYRRVLDRAEAAVAAAAGGHDAST
jgi:hypothetical protein